MILLSNERLHHYNRIVPSIVLVLLCLTIFVPRYQVGKVKVGFDDLVAALFLPVMLYYVLNSNSWILRGSRLFFLLLWGILISSGIAFGLCGSLRYLGRVSFPTEIWQYIKRMIFFYSALYFAFTGAVSSRRFHNILLYTLLGALLIGIIQLIPGFIGEHLADIYTRTEIQLVRLVERSFAFKRNYGIAGFSTAWGGFAMFSAAVALASLTQVKTSKLKLKMMLIFFAAFNVFFSGSRVAIFALIIVFFNFFFIGLLCRKKKLRFLLKYLFSSVIFALIMIHWFWEKFSFIFFRFETLIDKVGGHRIDQVKSALYLLDGWSAYLFGIGNATQRQMANYFGTEVEPIYLLVNYGILGILMRYGILLIIFCYSYRQSKKTSSDNRILAIAAMLSIIGYMIFSLGYFFYQEIYVGILPWILFGWVVGSYYRMNRFKKNEENAFMVDSYSV